MFNTFIIELRQKAIEKGVDVESLVEKYRKRYDLGIQAGLTEEEIVNRFGKIEDIVESLNKNNEKIDQTIKGDNDGKTRMKKLTLKVGHNGNLYIRHCSGSKISYSIDSRAEKYYDIVEGRDEFSIISRFKTYVQNVRGDIVVEIGDNLVFDKIVVSSHIADIEAKGFDFNADEVKINVSSADVIINSIHAEENLSLSTVSGDMKISRIESRNASVSTVSGDYNIRKMTCKALALSSVSGDVEIGELLARQLDCSTVSGDVEIKEGNVETSRSSSISGDIYLNNHKDCTNLGEQLRKVFRKGE